MSKYRSLQRSLHAPNASLLYSAIQDMADCSNLPPNKASFVLILPKVSPLDSVFSPLKLERKMGSVSTPYDKKQQNQPSRFYCFCLPPAYFHSLEVLLIISRSSALASAVSLQLVSRLTRSASNLYVILQPLRSSQLFAKI